MLLGLALYGSSSPDPAGSSALLVPIPTAVTSDTEGVVLARRSAEPDFAIAVRGTRSFIWPVPGEITTYFGPGHPLGIDIGLDAGEDSVIKASAAGAVRFAGGHKCCEYGYYVVVDHDGGVATLYGHLSEIWVTAGAQVDQGQALGLGGSTGYATGKHLHFEVQAADQPVDPLRYLPVDNGNAVPASQAQLAKCPSDTILIDPASQVTLTFQSPGYEVTGAVLHLLKPASVPPIETDAYGAELWLAVPPMPAALGETADFELEVTLRKGEDEQQTSCGLRLRTNRTLANSPDTIAGFRQRRGPPPTPTATPTKTPLANPTLVPTATPWKGPPPRAPATPTPRR